jgi:hypothetical protein
MIRGAPLGPVSLRIFFQKFIQLSNPFLKADSSGFCRAAYDISPRTHFAGFNQLKLFLELGAHFDPILNEIMNYSHDFTPVLFSHHSSRPGASDNII